jgi:hypothetical protein
MSYRVHKIFFIEDYEKEIYMAQCFVIQPFDNGGPYDKRYRDVYKRAIEKANLKAYRVDEQRDIKDIYEEIEKNISISDICFADISTNNPNVWFEVGYAIALRKIIVFVCSKERKKYPFDVNHRPILKYQTDSSGDFQKLRQEITKKLNSLLIKEEEEKKISSNFPEEYYGRWEGRYKETDQKDWFHTVHEISKKGLEITIAAYGVKNKSSSLCSFASKDKQDSVKLIWTYESKNIEAPGDVPDHTGTHIALFSKTINGQLFMKGTYFNDREQFQGRVGAGGIFECIWVSKDILHGKGNIHDNWPLMNS